ncbi:hypothetical protein Hypma_004968 [Hypsizygus marmoreus]|uniref:Uncharacterized protein n=1 Tax=Hypsizygus marmoreus TaxID=39966 RepID=A0A369K303_HYPMA|nr:hypothetical protein Hypma_004968 [Hypsizygus marmoreus]
MFFFKLVIATALFVAPAAALATPAAPVPTAPSTCPGVLTTTDSSLELVRTKQAAAPPTPISQGVISGEHLFTTGFLPQSPGTGELVGNGDIKEETRAAFANIKAVVEAAGSSVGKIVRVNAYLTTLKNLEAFNEVFGEFFGNHKPARTTLSIPELPFGALVEMDVIARL